MKNSKNTIRVLMMAAIASMMVVGTDLASIQSFATRDAKDYQNDIREEIDITEKKEVDQNMDLENICYTSDYCRNSNLGIQTAGDDNIVKSFNDQSDNIEGNPGNPGNPGDDETATLNICKEVENAPTTNFQPSDFIFAFDTTASPALFEGANDGCTAVTVDPGNYQFREIGPFRTTFFAESTGGCGVVTATQEQYLLRGTIAAGETQTCTIVNTITPLSSN